MSLPLLTRAPVLSDWGPIPMTSINFITSSQTLSPDIVTLGVGTSTYELRFQTQIYFGLVRIEDLISTFLPFLLPDCPNTLPVIEESVGGAWWLVRGYLTRGGPNVGNIFPQIPAAIAWKWE